MMYSGFADVYDMFMENVDYDKWVDNITTLWRRYGLSPGLALDLCCGTGSVAERLYDRGISMIGVDVSETMLSRAKDKAIASKRDILYVLQDMRALDLYGTVDAVVCICDGMNYLLTKRDFLKVLNLCRNYLNPGGMFIFDMNTDYLFRHIYAENTFADKTGTSAYIWENYYDGAKMRNYYNVSFFVKSDGGVYKRFDEFHTERAYDTADVLKMAEKVGLENLFVLDAATLSEPSFEAERLLFGFKKPEIV